MRIVLFLVGLYFGSVFVIDLINYNSLFLDIQSRHIDSSVLLHLGVTLLAFWIAYKYKKGE